jgi:cyclopropane-fatty-acyl-phospholipid synthase
VIRLATSAAERLPLPDTVLRLGIDRLVGATAARLAAAPQTANADFIAQSSTFPIATHVRDANEQHYELPPDFFGLVLGPRRKYSCCLFDGGADSLEAAEILALEETCRNAGLADGQHILELGCGWGSLSLWMAEHFPSSDILAVSNSAGQRAYIESQAASRNLPNLRVVTADMNAFHPDRRFDRVVSVEMFEHMSNWPELLARVHSWLSPEGVLFVHVFTHCRAPYRFDHTDPADWIAQHFFTGGVMPSHTLIGQCSPLLEVEESWRWNGINYQRTAEAWLRNLDANRDAVRALLHDVYGDAAPIWFRRWRLFFLSTAGLFGYRQGEEWAVSQYRLRRAT